MATGADFAHFDVDREAARVEADETAQLGDSTWTNLTSFAGHGGKLLFYHGLSDPWFSPLDTLAITRRWPRIPAMVPVDSWSRHLLRARHGPLPGWKRDAGSLRHAERRCGLGGERRGAGSRSRHRPGVSRAAAVRCARIRSTPSTLVMVTQTTRAILFVRSSSAEFRMTFLKDSLIELITADLHQSAAGRARRHGRGSGSRDRRHAGGAGAGDYRDQHRHGAGGLPGPSARTRACRRSSCTRRWA